MGTEWGRQLIGPGLWTRIWRHRAEEALADGSGVVADVRFPDEGAVIRAPGGVVVRIARLGIAQDTSHVSEAQDLPADLEVANAGSLADYEHAIVDLGQRIMGRMARDRCPVT